MAKIIIAAGGTGGHLFPAQALAKELCEKNNQLEIIFVGGELTTNRYFYKELFSFREIFTSTPYRSKKSVKIWLSWWTIIKGIRQSLGLLSEMQPKVVIGFGSYHAFPMLCAALFKRVPIIICESDFIPGKVNRLFARWAHVSAIQFEQASKGLKGKTVPVHLPLWKKKEEPERSCEASRAYFALKPLLFTLLVFGGSQGAVAINRIFCEALTLFPEHKREFQVIHITGREANIEEISRLYDRLGIPACVKEFEEYMYLAWRAANLAICRAGAATLAEHLAFEVPAIFIPYPSAAADHQTKNAFFMEKEVGGALCLIEKELTAAQLSNQVQKLLDVDTLISMQSKMRSFKKDARKVDLSTLIHPFL